MGCEYMTKVSPRLLPAQRWQNIAPKLDGPVGHKSRVSRRHPCLYSLDTVRAHTKPTITKRPRCGGAPKAYRSSANTGRSCSSDADTQRELTQSLITQDLPTTVPKPPSYCSPAVSPGITGGRGPRDPRRALPRLREHDENGRRNARSIAT